MDGGNPTPSKEPGMMTPLSITYNGFNHGFNVVRNGFRPQYLLIVVDEASSRAPQKIHVATI